MRGLVLIVAGLLLFVGTADARRHHYRHVTWQHSYFGAYAFSNGFSYRPVRHYRNHAHYRMTRMARRQIAVPAAVNQAAEAVGAAYNVVATLADKAAEIVAACGSKVISDFRPGAVIAGTNHRSLHAVHKAIDIAGNPACIYSHLTSWPGGYSTDYARVAHVHVSYDPNGQEWGARFVHGGGGRSYVRRTWRRRTAWSSW
jgi:hypothetical protein